MGQLSRNESQALIDGLVLSRQNWAVVLLGEINNGASVLNTFRGTLQQAMDLILFRRNGYVGESEFVVVADSAKINNEAGRSDRATIVAIFGRERDGMLVVCRGKIFAVWLLPSNREMTPAASSSGLF